MAQLDGAQMRLYHSLAPQDCDEEANIRAFAVCVGAAAAAATRQGDALDLGATLQEQERREWEALTHLLMRLADRYTFGTDVEDGEAFNAALEFARLGGERK